MDKLKNARDFSCASTSRSATLACPGNDGGDHNQVCDLVMVSVQDRDREHEIERDALLAELRRCQALMLAHHAPATSNMGARIAAVARVAASFGHEMPTRSEVDAAPQAAAPFRGREPDGEFRDIDHWAAKARGWLAGMDASCFDALGRPCLAGIDFMRARDEGTFPIRFWFPHDSATFHADERRERAIRKRFG